LVDGGVWANNPVGFAAVESIAVLGWTADQIRVLSLGCTSVPLDLPTDAGYLRHNLGILDLLFQGQSAGSMGTARLLIGDTVSSPRLFRIDPVVAPGLFALDDASKLRRLVGIGESAARDFLPTFRAVFLGDRREAFVPAHR
jgi:uncharacterized protein